MYIYHRVIFTNIEGRGIYITCEKNFLCVPFTAQLRPAIPNYLAWHAFVHLFKISLKNTINSMISIPLVFIWHSNGTLFSSSSFLWINELRGRHFQPWHLKRSFIVSPILSVNTQAPVLFFTFLALVKHTLQRFRKLEALAVKLQWINFFLLV